VNYTVIWKPQAEKVLATIWNDAEDRRAVTAASNEIDSQLGRKPSTAGEGRYGDLRILTVPPLSVYFDVSEDDCRVVVWAVWVSDRK
jgi:hypothetical protein